MKRRIYQLGEVTTLYNNEDVNALLRAKDYIVIMNGEDYWKLTIKKLANEIRDAFNIPYMVGLIPSYEYKSRVGVIIYEMKVTDDVLMQGYDEDKELFYIEVEED